MTESHPALRQRSPSAERNREPILAVLREALPAGARVLEIASGTGQHAMCFAAALPGVDWQPSDADADARASIAAWIAHDGLPNVRAPLALDVHQPDWGVTSLDALVCINMIHISPWSATQALFAGASRYLVDGGVLFLYGPYKRGGAHTSPSNDAFDQQLQSRDPSWGVRDMEAVVALGAASGLICEQTVAMPANNFSLVFRKRTDAAPV
jgi:cyclopropane fatty-acyl-phospholipid synthase-like methyltransferase